MTNVVFQCLSLIKIVLNSITAHNGGRLVPPRTRVKYNTQNKDRGYGTSSGWFNCFEPAQTVAQHREPDLW